MVHLTAPLGRIRRGIGNPVYTFSLFDGLELSRVPINSSGQLIRSDSSSLRNEIGWEILGLEGSIENNTGFPLDLPVEVWSDFAIEDFFGAKSVGVDKRSPICLLEVFSTGVIL